VWIHGKGLTFIECVIAAVIVVLFLVVVLPVFARDDNFREENLNTNLSQLRQQVGAYHRDYGAFSPEISSGEKLEVQMIPLTSANGGVWLHGPSHQK
jgi:competence protein ComGC